MLRTNLSTRPFYNVRAVHTTLGILGIIVVAFTVFNLAHLFSLSAGLSDLRTRVDRDERRALELRASATVIRRAINPEEFKALTDATIEANRLIDRRVFSWTDLFNQFEMTLPEDVRIAAVRPKIEKDGRVLISMTVVGRRVEAIDRFIENLEGTGAFANVLSREETVDEGGLLQTTLEGEYRPKQPAIEAAARQP